MDDEDLSVTLWLPSAQPEDLRSLLATVKSSGVLVRGNYAGDDPYEIVDYLVTANADGHEFRALFDLNLISPLVGLASGSAVPDSGPARDNARLAAACACFCILARILIEPNIALYEFASRSCNSAAQSVAKFFRLADNADALAYLDIALGRAQCLPPELLERVRTLPEIANQEVWEKDFERPLSMWKPCYLFALKTVALRRSGLSSMETALALTRWQSEESFFFASGMLYCIAAIAHRPPKGGMLKSINSENLESLRLGLCNAAWDMCLLQQFGKLAKKSEGPLWSLWSTDVALRAIAKSLFVSDDESKEKKLRNFYESYWGHRDGCRLFEAYADMSREALKYDEHRRRRTHSVMSKIDEEICALEGHIGIATR